MDIKRLAIFCKIIELKSFTRAAEATHLSQPSISENMRQLEDVVGEKLLDRLGREVVPTPAGQKLYPYARRILQLREEARQALASFQGELSGTLNIGTSTIPGTYILPAVIQEFKQRFPDSCVSARISGSGAILQGVLDGLYEFGLIGSRFRENRCQFEPLCEDQLVVALAADHPLARQQALETGQLKELAFIQREPDSGTRIFSELALRGAGCDPGHLRVVAELGSNEAVRQAVRCGVGAGIISLRAIEGEVQRGELVALALVGVDMRRHVYLVQRHKRHISPLAEAFIRHLRQQLG